MARDGSQEEAGAQAPSRKDPSAPKGRPTYGRKQRQAEARRRARRNQIKRRVRWALLFAVLIAVAVLLVVFDVGGANFLDS